MPPGNDTAAAADPTGRVPGSAAGCQLVPPSVETAGPFPPNRQTVGLGESMASPGSPSGPSGTTGDEGSGAQLAPPSSDSSSRPLPVGAAGEGPLAPTARQRSVVGQATEVSHPLSSPPTVAGTQVAPSSTDTM